MTEGYANSAVTDAKAPLERRLLASGPPLRGVEIKILDLETRKPLPQGQVGEIAIHGRVTPGYLNDVAATEQSHTDEGFFLTGDLGLLDDTGWLYFQGRRKELIKSGGINIAPAEIESVLREHPAVESAFIIGLPDERLDEAIGAVIITRPGHELSVKTLHLHCRQVLATYKIPHQFRFVEANQLPVTSTEKLQRNRLHELFE